jgi:hypothetical protein
LSGGAVDVTGFTKTPTLAGSYSFQAVYAGNGTYNSKTGPCEPLEVAKVTPNISTTPNPSSGTVGVTLNDSATVSGGLNPTGTVTFKLYPPSDATCAGTPAYEQTVPLSGGSASTSPGFVSNAAGTWRWTATYSGDGANNSVSSGCQAEQVTITAAGQGCTPGFWKNHEELWDSVNDGVVDGLIPPLSASALPNPPQFTYNPNLSDFNDQLFRQIFGLTEAQMTAAGLDADLTLLEALNTGGGQFEALVRHGTAALLSSEWVNYTYSASFVLNGVQDAFQASNYNLNDILTQLTAANNLDESACLTGS